MSRYRRNFVPGGTYFFTVALLDRPPGNLVSHIDLLREAIRTVRLRHPFLIDAWVVLPDHMHAVWTLPPGDSDYSVRWNLIKGNFSRRLPGTVLERLDMVRLSKRERGIWQRRFWEHTIRDEDDLSRHIDYVHYNPVKHGLALRPGAWPHSTFHRFVKAGIYPPDWSGAVSERIPGSSM